MGREKNVKLYKRFNHERLKGKVTLTLLIMSLISKTEKVIERLRFVWVERSVRN